MYFDIELAVSPDVTFTLSTAVQSTLEKDYNSANFILEIDESEIDNDAGICASPSDYSISMTNNDLSSSSLDGSIFSFDDTVNELTIF